MMLQQVGYLVKGPVKFSSNQITAAENQLKASIRAAREAKTPLSEKDVKLTNHFRVGGNTPEDFITKFKRWWEVIRWSKDAMFKDDPDNDKQIIVFAGSQTLTASPSGYAYIMLNLLHVADCFPLLGIK